MSTHETAYGRLSTDEAGRRLAPDRRDGQRIIAMWCGECRAYRELFDDDAADSRGFAEDAAICSHCGEPFRCDDCGEPLDAYAAPLHKTTPGCPQCDPKIREARIDDRL